MKNMLRLLPGFFCWLAKIIASAVLAAVMLAGLGYFVLTTTNPVKDQIKAQAKQALKQEVANWLFCSQPNP